MNTILIGTQNPGKLREFVRLLDGLPAVRLVTPNELGLSDDIPETGQTYAENARLKAAALAQASGLITLGDDSGVEVAALNGAPGLYSARFAGAGASDADRRQKLVHELRQVPAPRTARFVCVVTVAVPSTKGLELRDFEGVCPGEIVLAERGGGGFGYDPVFYLPEYGATMAELPDAVKDQVSHRARAVQAVRPYLQSLLLQPPAAGPGG